MDQLEFWKMNGSGNDFILIDNRDGRIAEESMGRLVEQVCRRRESVGADGVIFVQNSVTHDFSWRFFNADGGEAEMCGNGGRCVARFAHLNGIAGKEMTFETQSGPIWAEVRGRVVTVLMPQPSEIDLDIDLPAGEGWKSADFVNTGVPHVVLRVEDLVHCPVVELGRMIRNHALFAPNGTNADFIRVTGPDSLEIRTYERGVEDETLACGTGAMAAALVSARRGLVASPARVKTRSGEEILIHFEKKEEEGTFSRVRLEGSTSIVYRARLDPEAL
ncbi:MAG: diaminopimelate epimerase [Thermodesulfobacteriota bacterium]